MLIALFIFIFTYTLISLRSDKLKINRSSIALFGAVLMILFGIVSPNYAVDIVREHLDTLALLLGMMILVACLELVGFFNYVSLQIVKKAKNKVQFLILLMVATAVLSALISNDTVVLLFTPIIIKSCKLLKTNPLPFLISEGISANIGSVATMVGNPQNAYIGVKSGISFVSFSAKLIPITILCMLIAIAIIYFIFRKELKEDGKRKDFLEKQWKIYERELGTTIKDYKTFYLILIIIISVFVGFLTSSFYNNKFFHGLFNLTSLKLFAY